MADFKFINHGNKIDNAAYDVKNDANQMNKQLLHSLLKNELLNGNNINDEHTISIVNILGGIDKILNDYFENNDLTATQLKQLKQILNPSNKSKESELKLFHKNDIYQDYNHWYYEFDAKHTLLLKLFGGQKAQKISNMLHHKITQLIFILCALTLMILVFYGNRIFTQFGNMICQIIIISLVGIPYIMFTILSSNKTAFHFVIKTFEFWLKAINSLYVGVLIYIYFYYKNASFIRQTTTILSYFIMFPLVTICISLFDALSIRKEYKIILSSLTASWYSYMVINLEFVRDKNDDYFIHIPIHNISMPIHSLISGSVRILAIFFWKQAILSYFRTKKNQAISIKYTPYLKWTNNNQKNNGYYIAYDKNNSLQCVQYTLLINDSNENEKR